MNYPLTTREVARILDLTYSYFRSLVAAGKVPAPAPQQRPGAAPARLWMADDVAAARAAYDAAPKPGRPRTRPRTASTT